MSPKFEQPEIPGRDYRLIEIPDDVARRMERDFLDDGDSGHPLDWCGDRSFPPLVAERFREFAVSLADSPVENLLILDHTGGFVHEAAGNDDSVPFPVSSRLRGSFTIHNHPEGTPPSAKDLEHLVHHRFGFVRVVTPFSRIFDVANGKGEFDLTEFVFALRFVDETSWAIAEESIRKHGLQISDIERFARRQHAVLMEMARNEYLCYSRRTWTNVPESKEKGE
jgi:hypothetical protein